MMKFFRKYTKHMLVALVVFILISWLLGSSLQALLSPDPGGIVVGQAFGEEVQRRRIDIAAMRGDTLGRMGIPWQRPWIRSREQLMYDRSRPLDPLHWMLVVHEARQSGLVITQEQVDRFKAAAGISPAMLVRLQEQRYLALDEMDDMIRDYLLVREHAYQNLGSVKASTPEIRRMVRDAMERADVRALVIPAATLVDEEAAVSEEEIRRAFEKYKDVLPGEGELGFGYKWPARVKLEYLVLNVAEVEPLVSISQREARDYWTQNKEQFTRPPEPEPPISLAATQPAESDKPKTSSYERFSEAEADVIAFLRKQRAKEEAERIMSDLLSLWLIEDWDFRKRGDDRFPVAPEVVKKPEYFEMVLQRYAHREPRFAPLIKVQRTDLLTPEEAAGMEGIGDSSFTLGTGGRHDFLSLTQSVQGLAEMPDTGESALRSLYLARYQTTDRVLKDFAGNCYGFRVTEVVEPTVPASVDEVRDRVVADVRMARAYEQAELLARRFADAARTSSMNEALEQDAELKEKLGDNARIQDGGLTQRMWAPGFPGSVLGYQDESLIEAVFELAQDFDADKPHPIAALAAPSARTWLVAEIQELKPVTETTYKRVRDQYRRRLLSQRRSEALSVWFDAKQIEKRTGWVVGSSAT